MKYIALALALGITACSQAPAPKVGKKPVTETPVVVEQVEPDPIMKLEEPKAGDYLELGFMLYEKAQYQKAAEMFSNAIGTNHLNDAGRALSYWHVADSYMRLGNTEEACEAASSFVTVAEDILDGDLSYSNNFRERFGLEERLQETRAYIHAEWARRSDMGSEDSPIPIQREDEIFLFLQHYAKGDCNWANDPRNQLHILLTCDGKGEHLYFDITSP